MMVKKRYAGLIIISLLIISLLPSCKKDKQVLTPVPFLTGRTWIADTITINPPATYGSLSTTDQNSFRGSQGWFKLAKLTLNEDGTVTCGGDYDLAFKAWRLINNNADIEITTQNGSKLVLRSWTANSSHFTYVKDYQASVTFDCTFIFK